MPYTTARIRRGDGYPLHRHPTQSNLEGRWHGPNERHPEGVFAHTNAQADTPYWQTYASTTSREQYILLLANPGANGARLIWGDREAIVAAVVANNLVVPIGERAFGIEIECCAPVGRLVTALRRNGVDANREEYNHTTRPHWKIVRDSSVVYYGSAFGVAPMELVSPILRGAEGLSQLQRACAALAEVSAEINRSCGLHIHHDARDFTIDETKYLAHNWYRAQNAISKVVAVSRRDNSYSRPLTEADLSIVDSAQGFSNLNWIHRYRSLNLSAYGVHGTFEIRQHQGTTDYNKISSWIWLGQKMVQSAKSELFIPETDNIETLLTRLDAPENLKSYLTERATVLATVGESEGTS